ncbi:uncharacterized protein LOC128261540 isoform X3 [Drosophila gunungcola]|uniref:uncharacterized protein LOC128261540 isoform X3 n=1 Tax=Drosophila gunungcola TaxID=103775 RepID=UPI0022E31767|nr:uncharacterized protein LOC128261540 isoform X3 [Drosophila gunungcola]
MDNIYHQDSVRATVMELDPMTQFIRSIYSQGLIIIFATVGAWLLLLVTNVHLHRYLPFPVYVLAITIFLTMVAMHCIPKIAYGSPWKWIMSGDARRGPHYPGAQLFGGQVSAGVPARRRLLHAADAGPPVGADRRGHCPALHGAQFNHGRLDIVEVMPREHLMICTLTLYLHTMMFFCCVCYFVLVTERKASTEPTTVTETDRKL